MALSGGAASLLLPLALLWLLKPADRALALDLEPACAPDQASKGVGCTKLAATYRGTALAVLGAWASFFLLLAIDRR